MLFFFVVASLGNYCCGYKAKSLEVFGLIYCATELMYSWLGLLVFLLLCDFWNCLLLHENGSRLKEQSHVNLELLKIMQDAKTI